jgi:hypothetical protein
MKLGSLHGQATADTCAEAPVVESELIARAQEFVRTHNNTEDEQKPLVANCAMVQEQLDKPSSSELELARKVKMGQANDLDRKVPGQEDAYEFGLRVINTDKTMSLVASANTHSWLHGPRA